MENIPVENVVEVTSFWTWKDDNGVVRTRVKPGAEIDLEQAKENTDAVNTFYEGIKFPLLVDTREIRSITRDARQHFTTNDSESSINSLALLIKSPVSKVIANFFMSVNKPNVPAKIFNSEEKAVDWLCQHLNK